MPNDNIRDLRQKHSEERKEELSSLYMLMLALAQRDCFPSGQLKEVKDKDGKRIGLIFDFANPWYVAEPISTIQDMTIYIDDYEIRQEYLFLIIRRQKVPISIAKTIHEIWWGFGETAQILIEDHALKTKKLEAEVELEVHLNVRTTMYYGIPGNLAQYVLYKRMEVQ